MLRYLAEGCSNVEIAKRCNLNIKSVERWVDTVYCELDIQKDADVNARVEAAKRYYLAVGIPPRVAQ